MLVESSLSVVLCHLATLRSNQLLIAISLEAHFAVCNVSSVHRVCTIGCHFSLLAITFVLLYTTQHSIHSSGGSICTTCTCRITSLLFLPLHSFTRVVTSAINPSILSTTPLFIAPLQWNNWLRLVQWGKKSDYLFIRLGFVWWPLEWR